MLQHQFVEGIGRSEGDTAVWNNGGDKDIIKGMSRHREQVHREGGMGGDMGHRLE